MKHAFAVLLLNILICGCATKRLVLQAEVVSMTQTDSGSSKNLKVESQEFEEEWCTSDDPVLQSKDKIYGLADQVIYKAQTKGQKADFITGASVYVSGACASITGKRARI